MIHKGAVRELVYLCDRCPVPVEKTKLGFTETRFATKTIAVDDPKLFELEGLPEQWAPSYAREQSKKQQLQLVLPIQRK